MKITSVAIATTLAATTLAVAAGGTPADSSPPGGATIEISAAGEDCDGLPTVEVLANDEVVATWSDVAGAPKVQPPEFERFTQLLADDIDLEDVGLRFTNDAWVAGRCDRNLRVQEVAIQHPDGRRSSIRPAETPVHNGGAHSSSLGRCSLEHGAGEWMLCGGTMTFDPAAAPEVPPIEGMPTDGGAGGRVITVTSLADSGPGTLRDALAQEGPRIVRFAIGGRIELEQRMRIEDPHVTIDGGSAPAPGITITNDRLVIAETHDVIIDSIRIHVGELTDPDLTRPGNRDAISINGEPDEPSYNIAIINSSLYWSTDALIESWGGPNHDILLARNIFAEGLNDSINPEGKHSYGVLIGPGGRSITIRDNLFAHNNARNPVIHGDAHALVMNNLIYNPAKKAFHLYVYDRAPGATLVSAVGNVVIAGPSLIKDPMRSFGHEDTGYNSGSQVYFEDNTAIGVEAWDPDETGGDDELPSPVVDTPPIPFADLDRLPASAVEEFVLSVAGARPSGHQSAEDARVIAEVRSGTGQLRDDPTDPALTSPG